MQANCPSAGAGGGLCYQSCRIAVSSRWLSRGVGSVFISAVGQGDSTGSAAGAQL